MDFFMQSCENCGKSFNQVAYFSTDSPFYPNKVLNLCATCVEKMLAAHENDLGFADKLCQWADVPFDINQWTKIYASNKERAFTVYYSIYQGESRKDVNWKGLNDKWVELNEKHELEDSIELFSDEKLKQLQTKWGPHYDEEELNYLEQLFNGMLQTQNINGKLQMDQAIKLCKVSLTIDMKIRSGESYKDDLANYDKLVKIADFTPKNVKNANDFDSAGEIFAYLEKTGWINKYYDGAERDVVDKTIKNIQAWLRYLYTNETGIAEDIEKRIEGLKIANELENQDDMTTDVELDNSDASAYDFEDEDFDPELD